ncbi:uncharacterized protein LOC135391800 [Ornithodoros turicata]|uniref:uncharacterized protein LOC135391800 n=1 Tax=Ornithodoros turicata TaxID=34597 RepID=UPI00313A44F4
MFREAFLAAAFLAWCHTFSVQGSPILPRPLDVSIHAIIDDSYVSLGSGKVPRESLEAAVNGATLKYAGGFRNVHIRLVLTSLFRIGSGKEKSFMKLRKDGHLDGKQSLKILEEHVAALHEEERAKAGGRAYTKHVVLLATGRAICASPGDNVPCKVVEGIAVPRSLCTNASAAIVTCTSDVQEPTERVARYMAQVLGADAQDNCECGHKEDSIFDLRVENNMIAYLSTIHWDCLSRRKNPKYFLTPGRLFHERSFCGAILHGRPDVRYCGSDDDLNHCQLRCCSPRNILTEVFTAPDGTPCDSSKHAARLIGHASWSNSTDFLNARLCYRGRCTATAADLQYILKSDKKRFEWKKRRASPLFCTRAPGTASRRMTMG